MHKKGPLLTQILEHFQQVSPQVVQQQRQWQLQTRYSCLLKKSLLLSVNKQSSRCVILEPFGLSFKIITSLNKRLELFKNNSKQVTTLSFCQKLLPSVSTQTKDNSKQVTTMSFCQK